MSVCLLWLCRSLCVHRPVSSRAATAAAATTTPMCFATGFRTWFSICQEFPLLGCTSPQTLPSRTSPNPPSQSYRSYTPWPGLAYPYTKTHAFRISHDACILFGALCLCVCVFSRGFRIFRERDTTGCLCTGAKTRRTETSPSPTSRTRPPPSWWPPASPEGKY